MHRRVFVLAVVATAGSLPALVRAQSTTVNGCAVGIVNGLVQFSPDCPLLSPPGLGFDVLPPGHLMPQATDTTSTSTDINSPAERRDLKMQRKRDKKRERGDDQRRKRRHRRDLDARHQLNKQNRRTARATGTPVASS